MKKKATETCTHSWIIEPAQGPTSDGACKVCGAIGTFSNYVDPSGFGGNPQRKRTARVDPEPAT